MLVGEKALENIAGECFSFCSAVLLEVVTHESGLYLNRKQHHRRRCASGVVSTDNVVARESSGVLHRRSYFFSMD